MNNRWVVLGSLVFAAMLSAFWFMSRSPCGSSGHRQYVADVSALVAEFADTAMLAGSTPRSALPPLVQDLQSVRRRAGALLPGPCGIDEHRRIIAGMDSAISGMIDFVADADNDPAMQIIEAGRSITSAVGALKDTIR